MSDLNKVLADAAARLSAAGIDNARIDVRILLGHAIGVPPNELVGSIPVDEHALARFQQFVERRARHEPIAYITGIKEFWSLEFEVGPGVLVPRPETETLIEEALKEFPDRDAAMEFLDLGTGSGCILVAALHEFPSARGLGVDNSEQALTWSRRNIAGHGMSACCALHLADWNSGIKGPFDAIFSNPPYIAAKDLMKLADDVKRYEPVAALIGGEDGYDAYRSLAPVLVKALKPKGGAFVELGLGQAESVLAIFEAAGLKVIRIAPDLAGVPRCIVAMRAA